MNELKGFSLSGRGLVTEDFLKGIVTCIDPEGYLVDLDFGRTIDLAPLREVIEVAMHRNEHSPSESDSWLASRVHATLRLTRREAGDRRVWTFLNIAAFPEYVQWRWNDREQPDKVPLARYIGEDSTNAFARLWWGAELTRNGKSYERSVVGLNTSRFFVSWLSLIMLHHRSAALAVVDFLGQFSGSSGATDPQGQVLAKATNLALRTVSLDALAESPPTDAYAVRQWINEKIDVTTMLDALPVGPDEEPVPDVEIAKVRSFLNDLAARIKLGDVKTEKRKIK